MPTAGASDLTVAPRAVCDLVRSTVGPCGANKLLVKENGSIVLTADGAHLLDELDVDHHAVTVLRTTASNFRTEHSDGTGRLLLLVGALLRESERLRDLGLHPSVIERGYAEAQEIADEVVQRRAVPLSEVGTHAVARSALTGVRNPYECDHVVDLLTGTVDRFGLATNPTRIRNRVGVKARLGGARAESELVPGIVLDETPVIESMPRHAEDTGIALLSASVDVPQMDGDDSQSDGGVSLTADSVGDVTALSDYERDAFRDQLRRLRTLGCRVVATSETINDRVKGHLANEGLVGLQRIDDSDLARLARATDAHAVPSLKQVSEDVLGAGNLNVRRIAGRDMTFVTGSPGGNDVYTLLCRAPDPRSVEDFRRSVEGALHSLASAIGEETVLPGGGAVYVATARAVREHSRSVSTREALAVEAFGDALLAVPRQLATSGGLDGVTAVTRLVAAHSEGRSTVGVDALTGDVRDVLTGDPIVDPIALERHVVAAATELARKFIRIDGTFPAREREPEGSPGPESLDDPANATGGDSVGEPTTE